MSAPCTPAAVASRTELVGPTACRATTNACTGADANESIARPLLAAYPERERVAPVDPRPLGEVRSLEPTGRSNIPG